MNGSLIFRFVCILLFYLIFYLFLGCVFNLYLVSCGALII